MIVNVKTKLQPMVFISHKSEDKVTAIKIKNRLSELGVNSFLDVVDLEHDLEPEELTNRLKLKMEESSDLLAVVSDVTEKSWWVPFEIGMAAHVNLPMVSFLKEGLVKKLPGYLRIWPSLSGIETLKAYADQVKLRFVRDKHRWQEGRIIADESVDEVFATYSQLRTESSTDVFYRDLNMALSRHVTETSKRRE